MIEKLKLAQKVTDKVDRANRKICVTLLRYTVDEPESSYAQIRLIAGKKEGEEFQQIVYVNWKLEESIYLLDVTDSVYYKVFTKQLICFMVSIFNSLLFIVCLSIRVRMSWNNGDFENFFLKLNLKLGLNHVVITIPKTPLEKPTITVIEISKCKTCQTLKKLFHRRYLLPKMDKK